MSADAASAGEAASWEAGAVPPQAATAKSKANQQEMLRMGDPRPASGAASAATVQAARRANKMGGKHCSLIRGSLPGILRVLPAGAPMRRLLFPFFVVLCACAMPRGFGAGGADAGADALILPPELAATDGRFEWPLVAKGGHIYSKYCTLCHGARGEGYAADNAPSLVNPSFRATVSEDFLRAGIERGRPGTAMGGYGRSVGGPLAREDVDALLAFLQMGAPPPVPLASGSVLGNPVQGKFFYDALCAVCHGTVTQRATALHLANPVLQATVSTPFLKYALQHGRPGTKMEAWEGKIAPRQIEDIIAYVRTLSPTPPPVPAAVPPAMPPAPPPVGPIILNPNGKTPTMTLRDDRFAPLDDVKRALDDKRRIVIIDARPPSDWLNLHITGSISVPYYDMKGLDLVPNDGTWVVAYCACPHHASGVVVDELRKRGYKHAVVLDEGVFAWQHKGYPVVQAAGALPTAAPPPLIVPPPRKPVKVRK